MSYISIEQMLFGDYRVQVWDDNLSSLLDREYFCRGFISAMTTAQLVKDDLFPDLEIKVEPPPDFIDKNSDLSLHHFSGLPNEGVSP